VGATGRGGLQESLAKASRAAQTGLRARQKDLLDADAPEATEAGPIQAIADQSVEGRKAKPPVPQPSKEEEQASALRHSISQRSSPAERNMAAGGARQSHIVQPQNVAESTPLPMEGTTPESLPSGGKGPSGCSDAAPQMQHADLFQQLGPRPLQRLAASSVMRGISDAHQPAPARTEAQHSQHGAFMAVHAPTQSPAASSLEKAASGHDEAAAHRSEAQHMQHDAGLDAGTSVLGLSAAAMEEAQGILHEAREASQPASAMVEAQRIQHEAITSARAAAQIADDVKAPGDAVAVQSMAFDHQAEYGDAEEAESRFMHEVSRSQHGAKLAKHSMPPALPAVPEASVDKGSGEAENSVRGELLRRSLLPAVHPRFRSSPLRTPAVNQSLSMLPDQASRQSGAPGSSDVVISSSWDRSVKQVCVSAPYILTCTFQIHRICCREGPAVSTCDSLARRALQLSVLWGAIDH